VIDRSRRMVRIVRRRSETWDMRRAREPGEAGEAGVSIITDPATERARKHEENHPCRRRRSRSRRSRKRAKEGRRERRSKRGRERTTASMASMESCRGIKSAGYEKRMELERKPRANRESIATHDMNSRQADILRWFLWRRRGDEAMRRREERSGMGLLDSTEVMRW
jgi:hypothetical protein